MKKNKKKKESWGILLLAFLIWLGMAIFIGAVFLWITTMIFSVGTFSWWYALIIGLFFYLISSWFNRTKN